MNFICFLRKDNYDFISGDDGKLINKWCGCMLIIGKIGSKSGRLENRVKRVVCV